jgi:hypothetical protein
MKAILWGLAGLCFLACAKTDRPSNAVYPIFDVLYSAENRTTEVTATFRADDQFGAIVTFQTPNPVTVNDTALAFDPVLNRYYLRMKGRPDRLKFFWEDKAQNFYNFTVMQQRSFQIDSTLDTFYTARQQEIRWNGDPLASGEQAWVRLHGIRLNQGLVGARAFPIRKDQLSLMPQGNAVLLYPERTTAVPITDDKTVTGMVNLTYRAPSKTLYLK